MLPAKKNHKKFFRIITERLKSSDWNDSPAPQGYYYVKNHIRELLILLTLSVYILIKMES